jgi:hypothetical protein
MDLITHFVANNGAYTYTLPTNEAGGQTTLSDNLRDVVTNTTRTIGNRGGYDEFGLGNAPTEIGSLRLAWWIFANTPAEMTSQLQDIAKMVEYGTGKLYKKRQGETTSMFCNTRVTNINIPQNVSNLPFKQFRVEATFHLPDPLWYAVGTESAKWGEGIWGESSWGAGGSSYALAGTSTSFTFTNSGNATTLPRLIVTTSGVQTAADVTIQRLIGTTVYDQVRYNATLAASATLSINARAKLVTLGGSNAFNSSFTFKTADWLPLAPGANSLRVLMDNPSDAATLSIYAFAPYR